jgi:hypothetical protein
MGVVYLLSPAFRPSKPSKKTEEREAQSITSHKKKDKATGILTKRERHGKNLKSSEEKEVSDVVPDASKTFVASPPPSLVEVYCLLVCWIVYVIIWHGVLSNIPLSSPMPYGVHARFIDFSFL